MPDRHSPIILLKCQSCPRYFPASASHRLHCDDCVPATPPARPRRRSRPRLRNDPQRYLRRFGRAWQVWPYKNGERFYLGSWPSEEMAHWAYREWQAGRLEPRPKWVKLVHTTAGEKFLAMPPVPAGTVRERVHATVMAAAAAVREALVEHLGEERAAAILKRS